MKEELQDEDEGQLDDDDEGRVMMKMKYCR